MTYFRHRMTGFTTTRMIALTLSSLMFLSFLTLNVFSHRNEQLLYTQLISTNSWIAWQLEREYLRFTRVLLNFGGNYGDVDHSEVMLRFDILLSRIPIILYGEDSAVLRSFAGDVDVAEDLERALYSVEPRVEALQRGDGEAAAELFTGLAAFEERLIGLSSREMLNPQTAQIRARLAHAQQQKSWLFIALAGSALLLIAQLVVEAVLSWRAAARERDAKERSRRLAVENRRLSERIGSFVAAAPAGFYVVEFGAQGVQEQYASTSCFQIAGSALAELLPARRFLKRVPRADRKRVLKSLRQLMKSGETQLEHRFARPDGEVVWLSHALRLVAATDRQTWEVVGVVSDINDRKMADLAIQQGAKMMLLGEMATGLAHEMNQPLTVIRMAAENAIAALDRKNPTAQVRAKLERINAQTSRAAKLIDQMRIFARAPTDDDEWFSLQDAFSGALDLIDERLRNADVRLQIGHVDPSLQIRGQQQQLEQALVNIILNAHDAFLDAKDAGRDKVISIRIHASNASQRVRLAITDNAGGIPPAFFEKLFTPFVSTKPVGKGTGLGLWLTLGFVTKMGGAVNANNVAGGARFEIELPYRASSTAVTACSLPVATDGAIAAPAPIPASHTT
jgi:PAS domain S-box-containing protein